MSELDLTTIPRHLAVVPVAQLQAWVGLLDMIGSGEESDLGLDMVAVVKRSIQKRIDEREESS